MMSTKTEMAIDSHCLNPDCADGTTSKSPLLEFGTQNHLTHKELIGEVLIHV